MLRREHAFERPYLFFEGAKIMIKYQKKKFFFFIVRPLRMIHKQCFTILNKSNYREHKKNKKITNMVFVNSPTVLLSNVT